MNNPPSLSIHTSYAWFFDIDGTLLDFADTPESVHVSEQLKHLLGTLKQHSAGALALVTGRSIASSDALFHPLSLPTAGQHGLERRDVHGQLHYAADDSLPDEQLQTLLAIQTEHPGTLVENKGGCVAVHFRRVPELGPTLTQLVETVAQTLSPEFEILTGHNVVEVKRANVNKGNALSAYLAEHPFSGRMPLFFGDDTTDIPAMERAMELGGIAVGVGPKPLPGQHSFDEVSDLLDWLSKFTGQTSCTT